ncbi:MAG: hypothetical protein R3C39_02760 [Dehalococcoidia bacterium]
MSAVTLARRAGRAWIPSEPRLGAVLARRALRDRLDGVQFASPRTSGSVIMPVEVSRYELSIADYAGQEQFGAAKRRNMRLLAPPSMAG